MSRTDQGASLRSLMIPVYAPGILLGTAQGAIIPFTPLTATSLGATVAIAGLITAARGLGTMAFDIPAGRLMARVGDRRAMLLGTVTMFISLVGSALSPNALVFGLFTVLYGCAWAIWMLSRMTYISAVVAPLMRGRALSALGATSRVGALAGPLAGALIAHAMGLSDVFYLAAALTVLGGACFMFGPEHDLRRGDQHARVSIKSVVSASPKTFAVIGSGSLMVSAMRGSRQIVIPLWGEHVGLSPSTIGVIFGISAAADLLVSYPAGVLSDRWDRRAAAVPCLALLGLGQIGLLTTSTLIGVTIASLVMGIGNGFGSGIVMTLGTDLAPERGRAQFLAVWRLVSDTGLTAGPFFLSAVAAVLSFTTGAVALGAMAVGAAVMFQRSELLKGPSTDAVPQALDPATAPPPDTPVSEEPSLEH
ncbi:MAG: transporter [Marmoricola sp.]|jgi:MFS family permease|nr:transporter [Marmoricola sp.]